MIVELAVLMALARNGTTSEYLPRSKRDDSDVPGVTLGDDFLSEFARTGTTVTSTTVFSPIEQRMNATVASVLATAKHRSVANLASQVIAAMTAAAFEQGDADVPPLLASEDEDGTIFVEWIFNGRRVGLTFDKDIAESGWHFISGEGENIQVSLGSLSDLEPSALTRMALSVA